MSTITRELAKLFRKITNSEIDAEGNAHVVLSPADSLLINNARIALASLEAEPVAWAHRLINKRNGVVHPWVYGSAEACPSEGDIFNIEVMPLYTVPPAPVSVPVAMEMDDDFDSAFEHGKAVGWNAYRAAMLQAEPVSNSDELREKVRREHAEWSQATFGDVGPVGPLKHLSKEALEAAAEPRDLSEWADMQFLLWDAQRRAGISDGEITAAMEEKLKVNMARQWPEPKDGEPRLHIKAAPQQEVTQALAKGMERYGDAMQKLADSGD
ncbi:DUF550 domain-containing protein [Enterobacter asburiae]|uniref:DUF550 domain-containing protein n=1 Tax=Enterobacter asburiae TaxID=61645 RepID=UPI001F3E0A9D|nr:DUF550 domain-containing protein [Enterobacter asburiae]